MNRSSAPSLCFASPAVQVHLAIDEPSSSNGDNSTGGRYDLRLFLRKNFLLFNQEAIEFLPCADRNCHKTKSNCSTQGRRDCTLNDAGDNLC